MRKAILCFALWISASFAQTTTGTIQGTVTDTSNKPMAGALVTITRTAASATSPKDVITPYSQSVKSAADGSFSVPGLTPGTYSYCAQISGTVYVNGCRFGQPPADLTVSAGQKATANIRLAKGSVVKLKLLDPGNVSAAVSSSKGPPILMGVWDTHGRFLPAQMTSKDAAAVNYQVIIPLDTPLNLQLLSAKLKLADSVGAALPSTAAAAATSQTAFQQNSTDPVAKSFQFTITGVRP